MAKELAFTLINPYTIQKSRTGGVIARYLGRTGLSLAAARMFAPSAELVKEYASLIRSADRKVLKDRKLLADYIEREYSPDPVTGKPARVMLLLFEGEDAVRQIWKVTGKATSKWLSGISTVRDTYGDYVLNSAGKVQYFEPAVLVSPTVDRAGKTLKLWAKYSSRCGGLIESAEDVPEGEDVQRTLLMLKPDNFRFPSLRPGNIIDILSSSGLRIVAAKKFSMTVAQAEEFYGPVKKSLQKVFEKQGANRAAAALSKEFGFDVSPKLFVDVCSQLGPQFAETEFENIVQYMTGYKPSECSDADKRKLGKNECLGLVYEGVEAIRKIRKILGATDPRKAKPGSVRYEFGTNVMINAAHASDSPENAEREMKIIDISKDTVRQLVQKYYGK